MRRKTRPIITALFAALAALPARADETAPPTQPTTPAPPASTTTTTGLATKLPATLPPRGLTRVRGTVRPFFSSLGRGGGAIADLAIDHQFAKLPLRLYAELNPLALAIEGDGPGAIGYLRLGAAFSTKYIEFGSSFGSRVQNYGGSGLTAAGFLRLGAIDGLKFTLNYGYAIARNPYTGKVTIGMSDVTSTFDVPLSHRLGLAFFAEGSVSKDRWIYANLGLRHRLTGDGGPGTWIISGSLGVAWVLDRPECAHPGTGWCTESAWAAGPTLGIGLERRF